MNAPTPNLKPTIPAPPDNCCGCCEGVDVATPQGVTNRDGLSSIAYRIGDYAQFRASLHARLSSSQFAPLAGLRTRDDGDFTIGLLDAFACSADVLTFYQERIVNESYLRTAKERVSLQEMGKLVGYRLRPGIAAETWLAFALETPPTPPPNLSPEPGNFITGIPSTLALDIGFKVQSVPGPGEKPQVFETVDVLPDARPQWNAMRAVTDEDRPPLFGAVETWLTGTSTQLKPGDTLLFVGPQFVQDSTSNRWDARVLTRVEPDNANARTRVAWDTPLGSVAPFMQTADPPSIYALRERAAIFGHNAASWPALSDEFKASYLGLESPSQLTQAQRKEWPQFDIFAPGTGSGLQIVTHVSAMEAANVLRDTVHATELSIARESATSAATLGSAAGTMVQRIASLPADVARSALDVASKLPEAIGNVAQQVMTPLRDLVGNVTASVQQAAADTAASLGPVADALNSVIGAVNGLTQGNISTIGAPSAGPVQQPAAQPNLFTTGIGDLTSLVGTVTVSLDDKIGAVGRDLRGLWQAHANLVESVVAGTAATAHLARLEAELTLQPRVPFATAESVCDAVDAANAQAKQVLPDFTVATVVLATGLLDPRIGAALLPMLLSPDDLPSGADVSAGFDQFISAQSQVRDDLQQALSIHSDPIAAGSAAAGALAPLLGAIAQGATAPVEKAVQRLRKAAAKGVNRMADALSVQTDALRAGQVARVLLGHQSTTISLDRDYTGVLAGSYALLSKPDYIELYHIDSASFGSRAEFAISGKSTYLTLSGQNLSLYASAVRETTVFARSELLPRARAPLTTAVSGDTFSVAASLDGLVAGRRVIVKGDRSDGAGEGVHVTTLISATPAALPADGGTLVIDPPLPWALKRETVVVYGNVVAASHGESVTQILGSGNAGVPFQRFELKQLPLTYRAAPNEIGAAAELTVRVGDIAWEERSTMFGAAPAEHAYTLTTDEQGRDFIVFGDGVRGARPPSGSNNLVANYRKGLGVDGNVGSGTLTQLMTRPLGLKSVANPLAAEGGTDPESPDVARDSMPITTRTLGRVVSVLDYEDFARAFSGIGKAQAQVMNLPSGPAIAITIAAPDGKTITPASPVWTNLLGALQSSGDPHVSVMLLGYQPSTFRIGIKVKCDSVYDPKTVLANVEAALRAHYAFDTRGLGEPVQQSDVIAVAQAVPGVVALDLTLLYGGTQPLAQTVPSKQVRLLASRMRVQNAIVQPAELLTLDPSPLDQLEQMA